MAEAYRDLEQVSSRLALTERLAALLARTPPELLPSVCYLCQGLIAPEFAGVDLGLAEKLAVRAVATAAGTDAVQVAVVVRETGDLGQAAERLLARPIEGDGSRAVGLEVAEVVGALRQIAAAEGVPVGLFCFELLYADGQDLTMLPYRQRRAALEAALTLSPRLRLTTAAEAADPATLDAVFAQAVTDGCEGLVCKSIGPDSGYKAGARGWQWIKLKRDYRTELSDTADLVIIGVFAGRWGDDKAPEDATTTRELAELFLTARRPPTAGQSPLC